MNSWITPQKSLPGTLLNNRWLLVGYFAAATSAAISSDAHFHQRILSSPAVTTTVTDSLYPALLWDASGQELLVDSCPREQNDENAE